MAKAKLTDGDPEGKFIFLWIALDALCAVRPNVLKTDWWTEQKKVFSSKEKWQNDDKAMHQLEWFLRRICGLDGNQGMLKGVIEEHWPEVETVLKTRDIMANGNRTNIRISE